MFQKGRQGGKVQNKYKSQSLTPHNPPIYCGFLCLGSRSLEVNSSV